MTHLPPDNLANSAADAACTSCMENMDAYALDALDVDEIDSVVAHLDACPACREELARAREVVNLLPFAVDPFSPPPAVKAGLMVKVAAGERPEDASPVLFANPWRTTGGDTPPATGGT